MKKKKIDVEPSQMKDVLRLLKSPSSSFNITEAYEEANYPKRMKLKREIANTKICDLLEAATDVSIKATVETKDGPQEVVFEKHRGVARLDN